MPWLIKSAANNMKLPIDVDSGASLIKVLGTLKDSIGDLSTKSPIDILDELLTKPIDSNDPIVIAITKLSNRSIDEILQDWKNLQVKYNGTHGLKLRALARNFKELKGDFSSLPKLIDWKLIDSDFEKTPVSTQKVQFILNTGVAASLNLEAHAVLPELPQVVNKVPADKSICRIGMDGKLDIGGRVGFSAGYVSVASAVSATGSAKMDLYFLEEPDTHFGVAAAQNIRDLVSVVSPGVSGIDAPVDIDVLSDLLHSKDMHCMVISAESNLMFSAKVGFAKTYNVGEQIFVKAGVEAGATITETGEFEYIFAAINLNGENAIAVQVKRKSGAEDVSENSFGVEVDPREYIKSIQPMIEEHIGKFETALNDFSDYLPGSDFIRNELKDIIETKVYSSSLKDLALALIGVESSSSPEELLHDRLYNVIETSVASWSEDINAAVPTIVGEIQAGLNRISPNVPDYTDDLESLVTDALKKKRELLVEKVKQTVTNQDEFIAVSGRLNKAGARISKNIDTLQGQLDSVTKAVNQILNQIQDKISKLRDVLQTATEKTLTLKIASERREAKEESLNLRFNIFVDRDHDAAQKAINAILYGEMHEVFQIANGFRNKQNPPIVGLNGGYSIYKSLREMSTSELVLCNFRLGTTSIFDADVRLNISTDGTIVAQSAAEYKRVREDEEQRRSLSFVESTEMLFSKHRRTFNVGITLSHEDTELDVEDVTSFFDGLIKRNLLSSSAAMLAVNTLKGSSGRAAVKGRLDVGLTLTRKQLDRMMDGVVAICTRKEDVQDNGEVWKPAVTCLEGAGKRGCHWVLDTVSGITAEVVDKLHSEQGFIQILKEVLTTIGLVDIRNGIKVMLPDKIDEIAFQGYSGNEDKFHYYVNEFELLDDLSFLEYRRYGAMALYEILAHIKCLRDSAADIDLSREDPQLFEGFTIGDLEAHQFRVARLLPVWWLWDKNAKSFLFFDKKMLSLNVAFFESWIALAKGPDLEGEAPQLWTSITIDDDKKTTLLI